MIGRLSLTRRMQAPLALRLDLTAIEASLRDVQRHFDQINARLDTPRDPLGDDVLERLLAGYDYLNRLQAADIDLLARGNSRALLELNCLVLYGTADLHARTCGSGCEATERRFYDDSSPGGVRALMNYLADQFDRSVWRLAAGLYVHILSEPQLFLEGNHRTGALIMSHVLLRGGQPPFVLTPHNAKAYFDPSSLVKGTSKRRLGSFMDMRRLRQRMAAVLQETANPHYLICSTKR